MEGTENSSTSITAETRRTQRTAKQELTARKRLTTECTETDRRARRSADGKFTAEARRTRRTTRGEREGGKGKAACYNWPLFRSIHWHRTRGLRRAVVRIQVHEVRTSFREDREPLRIGSEEVPAMRRPRRTATGGARHSVQGHGMVRDGLRGKESSQHEREFERRRSKIREQVRDEVQQRKDTRQEKEVARAGATAGAILEELPACFRSPEKPHCGKPEA